MRPHRGWLVVPVVALAGCGGATHGPLAPLCRSGPRGGTEECKETSDRFLVPPSYYATLQHEENTTGVPHVSGEVPANPNDRQPATLAPAGFKANSEGTPTYLP
jgi:hypothetical protein